jgi:hypothetical protein
VLFYSFRYQLYLKNKKRLLGTYNRKKEEAKIEKKGEHEKKREEKKGNKKYAEW